MLDAIFEDDIPFRDGMTKSYIIEYLDLEEHCEGCVASKLKCSQPAARNKSCRDHGYQFYQSADGKRNYETGRRYCDICKKNTVHRRLLTRERKQPRQREDMPDRDIVLQLFDFTDSINCRKYPEDKLEIDHRIPHVRVTTPRLDNNSQAETIKYHLMVLTPEHNTAKKGRCESCVITGIRQPSYDGISYFYAGTEKYEGTCEGCFWFNPNMWRESLHKKIGVL